MIEGLFNPLVGAIATAGASVLAAWLLARVRSGRLERTLEQATKVIDFVERWSARHEGLSKISEENKKDVNALMLDTMEAVRKDFVAERSVPEEFGKNVFGVRRFLLLYLPHRTIIWPLYLLFHIALLFVIYVVGYRIYQRQFRGEDIIALLIAIVFAALIRLIVVKLQTVPRP